VHLHRSDLYFDSWEKSYCPAVDGLVREKLDELRPDVVHIHHWIRLTNNLVHIATEEGIPAVVTLHDLYTTCPRCFRLPPDNRACNEPLSADRCLACVPRWRWESEAVVRESIELYRDSLQAELELAQAVLTPHASVSEMVARTTGFLEDKLEAFGLCYTPRTSRPWGVNNPTPARGETVRIGCWGFISWRKGADLLLEALRLLPREGLAPYVLHLFGAVENKELADRLKESASGLPVEFHGAYNMEQIASTGLHVAVIPSPCFETYCFVLDEAFELGLPAVVPELGAPAHRVGDAGLRFAPGDAMDLSRVLARLLADTGLIESLAAVIPPPPEDPDTHARRLEKIYGKAVNAGPASIEADTRISLQKRLRHEFDRRESNLARAVALLEAEERIKDLYNQVKTLTKENESLKARLGVNT
jgi:glycosyltransferase involved in cell wall biosynthesis